jgi:hypothetical protein
VPAAFDGVRAYERAMGAPQARCPEAAYLGDPLLHYPALRAQRQHAMFLILGNDMDMLWREIISGYYDRFTQAYLTFLDCHAPP